MSTSTYPNRYLPSSSLSKPSNPSNYYPSQYQYDVPRQSNPTTNNNSIHYYGGESSKNPLTSNIISRQGPIKAYTSSTNPTFNIPPLNSSKKPSDSSSNYPLIPVSSKVGYTDILNRDHSKRGNPSPSVKPQRGLSIDKANSNKMFQDSSPGGLLGGQTSVVERENPRYGGYGPDLRAIANNRNLLGIGAQIKPQAVLSSSSRNYGGYTSPDSIFDGDDHSGYGRGNRAIAEGMSFSSSVNKYGVDREAEREPAGLLQRNLSGIKDRTLKEVYQPASSKIGESSLPAAAEQKSIVNNYENQNRKITSNANIRQALYTTSDYSVPAANISASENSKGSSLSQAYKADTVDYRAAVMKSSTITSSSEPKGLVGLKNIGNTCFMNSILQSLFNTAPLAEYFSRGTYSKDLNIKNEKGIAKAYADILGKIRAHTGAPSYSAESTFSLKRRIEESNSMFAGYDQHDAQEFLKALLEGINDDLNRITTKQAYKELKAEPSRPLQAISNEWYEYMLGRDNSIVTDLFSGQLLSRTTCTSCGFVSLAFDNYWDLSLSFTRGLSILNKCDLKRMLEHFLKEENLDDLFHCEKCKTKKKFKKGFVFWRLPQVLVIHLKRFHFGKYKKEKITQSVKFPVKNLDLSEFVKESQDPSTKDPTYSLFAVVNHSGSLNGGHYTADCMNPNNRKWYTFNDSSVRESYSIKDKDNDAEGDSPYILFYIKNSCL